MRIYYALVAACHFINLFFSIEKINLQKVAVVVIGVLHDMMVNCHLLRRKNDVICVRHEMKMKRNLMRQINRLPLQWSDISDTHPFLKENVF